MNLTVGPLSPAVYWRRRALVAGAVLVLVLVLLLAYSCGGSSGSGTPSRRTGAVAGTPTPDPTLSEFRPQTGSPAPASTTTGTSAPTTTATPEPSGATASATASAGSDICTDAEIQLTPSVQRITGGSFPYELTLKIKNVGSRTCRRDIGSNPQELHVVSSGQTVWSSDSCQAGQGQNNVATFGPGIEDTFHVGWDGSSGSDCTNPTKPVPPGTYQIVAKLDTKASAPVTFTIQGK
jgi:hypothetical protein